MYDFRQKRQHSQTKKRSSVHAKKVVMQPAKVTRTAASSVRRNVVKPVRNEPRGVTLLKTVGSLGLGIILIALCSYFFITKLATYIWPLTTVQTVLLVPSVTTTELPWVQILVLDPKTQTAHVAQLPGHLPLSVSGELTVAGLKKEVIDAVNSSSSGVVSLKLGRVMDNVVVLPSSAPLRTHADFKHAFQTLLSQDTPTVSKSEKMKWWLFILSLSDTQVRVKNSTDFSSWQAWLASMAQQQSTSSCSLALINTTPTTGLSRFISQVMEQSGYQIIRVDSQPKFLAKSQLFISPERLNCLAAAQRLQEFLPERIEVVQDLAATQQARSDIVWLLGSDVAGQAGQVME